jgi:hypothetical protein
MAITVKWQRLVAFSFCISLINCTSSIKNQVKLPSSSINSKKSKLAARVQPSPIYGDMLLQVPVLDSQVILKTSAEFSGSIYSLVFRGKEHIDSFANGRLLQSASTFDHYGECFNPTEAGSQPDLTHPRGYSNSRLIDFYVKKNQLWTLTNMAFWLLPGQNYPRGCGLHKGVTHALNLEERANHLFEKKVTIGLPNFQNVIEYQVTYHVPKSFSSGQFEAATGYMPEDFSLALLFNPITGEESIADKKNGEQSLPVILATKDRKYAMGVYSKQLPQPGLKFGYGHFIFPPAAHTNKWNCVFREKNVIAKNYQYTCLIILGTVDEVENTMYRLVHQ